MNAQLTSNRRKVLFGTSIFTAASALGLPMALIPSTGNAQPTGMPTLTAQLQQRALHRRAVEAVIWGMPAVNYDLMLQEMFTKTPGKVGQVIYWGRPLDSKNQTLTPNPDALYFMTFFDTKGGPMVLDLPPGDANGSMATSSLSGRCRSKMGDCSASIRARAENSSYFLPATRTRHRTAITRSGPTRSAVTC